jgi:hypothetical protein
MEHTIQNSDQINGTLVDLGVDGRTWTLKIRK